MPKPRVAIIYRYVPQYRADFYEFLRDVLLAKGVDLQLCYGVPSAAEAAKGDAKTIPWGTPHRPTYIRLGKKQLVWQPVIAATRSADLVIVEQATKLVANYPLWLRSKLSRQRFAFWGHGKDFQTPTPQSSGQKLKYWLSTRVDWWFAYNGLSARIVADLGYPRSRITSVQNTIDTKQLVEAYAAVSEAALERIRSQWGIRGNNVAIYSGGMYYEKRLPFLLNACEAIRRRIPDFEMIFIGGGTDREMIARFAAQNAWVHDIGPVFGADRVPFFKLAKAFLMPGLVGLAILDCFALQTPLVTTNIGYHSPEIDYLNDGVNGIVVRDPDDVDAYVGAVVDVMTSEARRRAIVENGIAAAQSLTIENMVGNFADGIMQALEAKKYRPGKRSEASYSGSITPAVRD